MLRESVLNKIPIYIMLRVWELYEDNYPLLDGLPFRTFFCLFRKNISKNYGLDRQESKNGY